MNVSRARRRHSIGTRLEWHLRKVFAKLDISSRKDLRDSLHREVGDALPA